MGLVLCLCYSVCALEEDILTDGLRSARKKELLNSGENERGSRSWHCSESVVLHLIFTLSRYYMFLIDTWFSMFAYDDLCFSY